MNLIMSQEQVSISQPLIAPEVRRREQNARLTMLALILPAILLTILFLYYPLVFIVRMSFTLADSFLSPSGPIFTLENYVAMTGRYLSNIWVTIKLAGLSTLVNLIFGFPFAYILVRKVRYRDLVRGFMVFPMFGALYVVFGMRFILLPSVVFAMSIFTFPFMVMNVGTALSNVDPVLEEAAACLGARPLQTFWRILLPLTRSGLIAGALMVFGWNVGTFAEPLLLGTINEQKSLAWTLYQRGVVQTDYGLSTTMGVVLLILAFTVTYFSLRYSRGALVE
jgi:ABC-type spermidine/putrescine transport system permease subunit I